MRCFTDPTSSMVEIVMKAKFHTRILAVLLAMVMILGMAPVGSAAEECVEIAQWNVTLSDDLKVKFYLNIPASAVANTQVAITVGSGDAVSYAAKSLPKSEEGYYIAQADLAAAQMTDAITVAVTTNNRQVLKNTYTVAQYANAVLKDTKMSSYHSLVKNMLNYGATAQRYFKHNTDALADSGIGFDEEITVPADEKEIVVTDKVNGISFCGASLLFRNKIGMRFYFRVSGHMENYSFRVNETAYEAVEKDGLCYVQVDGIAPQNYNEDVALTVSDGSDSQTVFYSPMHYITRMYHDEDASVELKSLLKAMYGYHLSACQFVAATYGLPEYWIAYLNEKIQKINEKMRVADGKTDAFIFITDQHLDGGKDYSAAIINYISAHTGINKVIFGGDMLQGGNNDVEILRAYRNSFDDGILLMPMRGNHDATGNLTETVYYDMMISPLRHINGTQGKLYYYYDNPDLKIRYIITDSVASDTNYLTSKEQIAWMQSKILDLGQDWTVMVFHHGIWNGSTTNKVLDYSVDGKLMVDAIDEIYDSARCTVAGLYSGHSHRDYFGHSEKGYALVSTTVNACGAALSKYDPENPIRTTGTTREEALDVVFLSPSDNLIETVRIGAGSDRAYMYAFTLPGDVSGVSLNRTEAITWVQGKTVALRAALRPARVTDDRVIWRIKSGEEIGTITTNGLDCIFTPGSATGTAIVEVKTVQGEFVAECAITVVDREISVDLTPEFTWTPGSITYADGVASSQYAKDWLYSNQIDIGNYDTITFTHVQTTNTVTPLGYAFYDRNSKYITGASNGGGTYETTIKTINVPDNAKYFSVMWMNTTHSRYDADRYGLSNFFCYGNIGASVPEIKQPVQGVRLNQTQVKVPVNSQPLQIRAVVMPDDATNKEVVWRIKSGKEIGSITANGLDCVFTPGSVAGTAVIEVKTLEGEFVAECTVMVVNGETSVDLTPEFTWTPGSITYANGVASSQYAKDWLYSNRVEVGSYDTITFTHIQTTNTATPLGYAFYDENGKYITGASNGGGTYETAIKTINVPDNAKYFSVMWMNTTHSRYNADKYGLTENFFCYGNNWY